MLKYQRFPTLASSAVQKVNTFNIGGWVLGAKVCTFCVHGRVSRLVPDYYKGIEREIAHGY